MGSDSPHPGVGAPGVNGEIVREGYVGYYCRNPKDVSVSARGRA